MGRHRIDAPDTPRRVRASTGGRGIAGWPLAVVALVALVAAGFITWSWIGGVLNRRADAAATDCPAGSTTIQVAVAPSISAPIRRIAAGYTAGRPIVADHCVRVQVSTLDPQVVLAGLTAGWDAGRLGPKPQAWLADTSYWTNTLAATKSATVGDTPQSVASSPIVLAVPPDAAKAVQGAGAQPWTSVPGLVAQANGWSTFGANFGRFTLALPDPAHNPASALALESMLDPPTPQGQAPITAALLNAPTVRQDLTELAGGQPTPLPGNIHDALVALANANGIGAAPFSAVPVAEVELYERNLGMDGQARPSSILDEVRVSGGTASLDFPFVPLAGDWVSSDQVDAAQHFRDFLLGAAQQVTLAKAGLRTADAGDHPSPSPGMDWGAVAQASTPTDVTGFTQLCSAWAQTH